MADGGLTRAARVRWRLVPWWGQVLLVFAASRVVSTVILLVFAVVQGRENGTATPDYVSFAANWDGQWFWVIALTGYPSELPLDAAGNVTQNAWAFLPVFPFLTAPFVWIGIPFGLVGTIISLLAGAVAALLLHVLLRENGLTSGQALFAVVLLCTAPLSPMFQVAYAESLGLALLFLALLLVQRRRFWVLLPVIVVMSLTRPSGLAFALFLLLYFVTRIVGFVRDRAGSPLPPREFWGILVAGLVSCASGLSWAGIAWWVTGSPSAYTDTELSWRASYLGHGEFVPFADWFQGLAFWLRFLGVPDAVSATASIVVAVALVVGLAVFLLSPWARRLGVELRLWLVAYPVYLMAVFFPQSSTWRLLLPMAPALGAFAVPPSRILRVSLVLLGVALQVLWVHWCWWRAVGDWSPP